MPYYFDSFEQPKPGETDLEQLWEMWRVIKNDLMNIVFEEEQDALEKPLEKRKLERRMRYLEWSFVPFRDTEDAEQLLHFHGLGLEALAQAESSLKSGRIDQEFAYYWGMLSACHGYVICAALARDKDLTSQRAALGSRKANSLDGQRRWFACNFFRPELKGLTRDRKTDRIEKLVQAITEGSRPEYAGLDIDWFKKLLNQDEESDYFGQITFAFRERKLTQKQMRALAAEPTDDIPPVDLFFPTP